MDAVLEGVEDGGAVVRVVHLLLGVAHEVRNALQKEEKSKKIEVERRSRRSAEKADSGCGFKRKE